MSRLLLLLISAAVVHTVLAFPRFADELPSLPVVNGGTVWGVGHVAPQGRGERNAFGEDFKRYGYKWTEKLCRADSDGDGFTNGQELGDPSCQWKKGMASPARGPSSHPGDSNSKPRQ